MVLVIQSRQVLRRRSEQGTSRSGCFRLCLEARTTLTNDRYLRYHPECFMVRKALVVLLRQPPLLTLLRHCESPGIAATLAALKACSCLKDLSTGIKVHTEIRASSTWTNIYVSNCLLDMYAKCGSLPDARRVFDSMQEHTVASWNSMIMAYVQSSLEVPALLLFSQMQDNGFLPDARTFVAVLKAWSGLAAKADTTMRLVYLERGRNAHSQATDAGYDSNIFVSSTLVEFYSKCGCMAEACKVFEKMSKRDVVSWNTVIMGHAQAGEGETALRLFSRMQEEGFRPDARTYVAVLKACCTLQEIGSMASLVKQIHSQAEKDDMELELFVGNTLVDSYVKCGEIVRAREVFDKMPRRDDVTWNSMIMGYAQRGESEMALSLFSRMQDERLAANARTYAAAFNACGSVAENVSRSLGLQRGRGIHAQLSHTGIEPDVYLASSLVDMYLKCGSTLEARRVFERISHPDSVCWTCMVVGHAQNGEAEEALELFQRMPLQPTAATFVAALNACAVLGSRAADRSLYLLKGRSIHGKLLGSSFTSELTVENSLLNMYAKCGSLTEAVTVFRNMAVRDVVSWTSMIVGCVHNGEPEKGLELYEEMMRREKPVSDDARLYVAALSACSSLAGKEQGRDKLKCARKGVKIHLRARQGGLDSDVYLANTLVDMYCKCGSMENALAVFETVRHHSLISWNAMILGYVQNGRVEDAIRCYVRIQEETELVPDAVTYAAVVKACASLACEEALKKGIAIHGEILRRGLEINMTLANSLVDMYVKCKSVLKAQEFFNYVLWQHDLVSWNSLILGQPAERALSLLESMQEEGLIPDSRTFIAVLNALTASVDDKVKKLEIGRRLHSEAARHGVAQDIFLASSLVDFYAKLGFMADARHVFEKTSHKDVVLWTTAISGHVQAGEPEVALSLLSRMRQEGCKLDAKTHVAVLTACSSLAAREAGERVDGEVVKTSSLRAGVAVHQELAEAGLDRTDTYVANALVDVYAKCGCMKASRRVFDTLEQRDVVSWSSLLLGYVHNGEPQLSLDLFARMQDEGPRCAPNSATFLAAVKACCILVNLEKGRKIHERIRRAGLENELVLANSLVDFYAKCGSLDEAEDMFDVLGTNRSLVTWNSLLAGYSHKGDRKRAWKLLDRMRDERVQPNAITFLHILSLCNHSGLVDEARLWFDRMSSEYGISPELEHYTCMVDTLGRAHRLEEAVEIVKEMAGEPDVKLWMTLLGACHKWRNVELGKQVFEEVVKMDSQNTNDAAYVLMGNILASAERVQDSNGKTQKV